MLLTTSTLAAEVRSSSLTINYSDPRDRAYIGSVFAAFKTAERDLRDIGLTVPKVRLEAARSAADLAKRTGEPWYVAASTRGAVIRTQRLGALNDRGLLALTIRHETFHTAQPARLPRWLAEGLARVFSGEAGRDSAAPTGLERSSAADLNALLASRDETRFTAAYREATRRARQLVRARGWAGALKGP